MPSGQYELPFTFQIPKGFPSTFKFIDAQGEVFSVSYNIHVYFNDPSPILVETKEIKVLETGKFLKEIKLIKNELSLDRIPPTANDNTDQETVEIK